MTLSSHLPDVRRDTAVVVGLVGGAEFVNHTYLVLFPPILGILAAEFDVSLYMLGIAMGVQGFTNTAFQLPWGYLSDNYDRRLTLGLSLGLATGSVFLIAVAPTFELLLAGQALLGVGIAGHHPAHFPILAAATPEHHRARAFSVRAFLGNLGFAAPPVVVTAIIAFPGLTWRHAVGLIGAVGAVYALLVMVAFYRYVDPAVTAPESDDGDTDEDVTAHSNTDADADSDESASALASLLGGVRREIRAITGSPAILALAVLALVVSTASWGITSYAVVLLQDGYGLGLDTANLTLSAMFAVGAVMVLVGGDLADRFAPGPVIVGAYVTVFVFVAAVATMTLPPLAAVACLLVVGGVRSLAGPPRSKLADLLSARADLGRNFAIITVGIMTGSSVAPPLFGALIEGRGLGVTFSAIAAIVVLAVFVTLFVLHRHGEESEAAAGAVEAE
ncbi:MFS transporter [Halorussus amylolyticus]|uniref:MFS transporter n=1 Tax=Halorussus amylolyticus TaxID=1126242 RepID=UPI00138EF4A9|nr:MFS transporter [Halorussus amylolyticus]